MKVTNIHRRVIHQPKAQVAELFATLASKNDMMLATDKWSPMILDNGLRVGSKGGHGPIRYTVSKYEAGESVQFEFSKPRGFHGMHRFEIKSFEENKTELVHLIKMSTKGSGTLIWGTAIRWLHDAFMEDAFDKVENHFSSRTKKTNWSLWVKILRRILKPKNR